MVGLNAITKNHGIQHKAHNTEDKEKRYRHYN